MQKLAESANISFDDGVIARDLIGGRSFIL